jgi:hypothetical protein
MSIKLLSKAVEKYAQVSVVVVSTTCEQEFTTWITHAEKFSICKELDTISSQDIHRFMRV